MSTEPRSKKFSEQELYKDDKFKLVICRGEDGRISYQFHVKFRESSVFAGLSAEKSLRISNLIYETAPDDLLDEKEDTA